MKEHKVIPYDLTPIELLPRYTMEDIVALLDIWSGLREVEDMISTMISGGPGVTITDGPLAKVKDVSEILARLSPIYDAEDDDAVNAFYALLHDETITNEEKARKLMGM